MYVSFQHVQTGVELGEEAAAAEAWVAAFAEGWRAPSGPDAFADHFEPLFQPDIRLIQPPRPPVVGLRAFREDFVRPLFALIPDLHGIVEGWAARGEVIFIELRLEGTLGGRRVTLRSIDRVTLRDGRALERVACFDPSPLLRALMVMPSAWLRLARTQLRQGMRRRLR